MAWRPGPMWVKVWTVRLLFVIALVLLSVLADSPHPSWAFALAWGPNGLFLVAFTKGALRLPGFLKRVHSIEPLIYQSIGVGLIKKIVATRFWPVLIMGAEPPSKPANRDRLLIHIELSAEGSEICHVMTFVLVTGVAIYSYVAGNGSFAAWTMGFNTLLNAYPVMLQRWHRFRLQQLREKRVVSSEAAIGR